MNVKEGFGILLDLKFAKVIGSLRIWESFFWESMDTMDEINIERQKIGLCWRLFGKRMMNFMDIGAR